MDKLQKIEYNEKLDEEECPICIDKFSPESEIYKSDICDHLFHKQCIERWIIEKPNCPKCRAEFAPIQGVTENITMDIELWLDTATGSVFTYIPGVGVNEMEIFEDLEEDSESDYENYYDSDNINDLYTVYYGSAFTERD